MNQKELKHLTLINLCEHNQLSVPKLRQALKVSKSGLGDRIIALRRKFYKSQDKQHEND